MIAVASLKPRSARRCTKLFSGILLEGIAKTTELNAIEIFWLPSLPKGPKRFKIKVTDMENLERFVKEILLSAESGRRTDLRHQRGEASKGLGGTPAFRRTALNQPLPPLVLTCGTGEVRQASKIETRAGQRRIRGQKTLNRKQPFYSSGFS
ncbi:MAG: hypothetical protein IPK58_05700 [Acidobacteria bacterium]|nr:hypothetical protein [Acidobacteriota bacterium]